MAFAFTIWIISVGVSFILGLNGIVAKDVELTQVATWIGVMGLNIGSLGYIFTHLPEVSKKEE